MKTYWCGRCRKSSGFKNLIKIEVGDHKDEVQHRCGKCGQHIFSEFKPMIIGKDTFSLRLMKRSDCEIVASKLEESGRMGEKGVEMRYEVDDISEEDGENDDT